MLGTKPNTNTKEIQRAHVKHTQQNFYLAFSVLGRIKILSFSVLQSHSSLRGPITITLVQAHQLHPPLPSACPD